MLPIVWSETNQMETQQSFGLKIWLETDYESALERVTAALKMEGFGVLTEIDVKATFKQKLDVEFTPYRILGACNPALAHRALTVAPDVGLLLPCNVTVTQMDDGRIQVAIVDPLMMVDVVQHADLQPIAQEAQERLERVIAVLEA